MKSNKINRRHQNMHYSYLTCLTGVALAALFEYSAPRGSTFFALIHLENQAWAFLLIIYFLQNIKSSSSLPDKQAKYRKSNFYTNNHNNESNARSSYNCYPT